MMHNNENYYFWGMHAGLWIFAFVVIIAVLVWYGRFRNKK